METKRTKLQSVTLQQRLRRTDLSLYRKERVVAESKQTATHSESEAQPALTSNKPESVADKHILIKLSLPSSTPVIYRRLKSRLKEFPLPKTADLISYKHFKTVLAILSCLVMGVMVWQIIARVDSGGNKAVASDPAKATDAKSTTPDFEMLVPGGSKEGLESRYDPDRRVFTFRGKAANTDIVVSQQKQPESFKLDPQGSLESFAKKINANTPIDAGGVKAFSGKSVNGPQTTVFLKDEKMLFIYAPHELPKELLSEYIKTLK
jgi:hypothetical protein